MTSGKVPYTQAGRMMAIATPLGEDVLLLEHLAIDEAINGLFTIQAQVKSQRDDLAAGDLIGSNVDFSLKLKDDGTRYWNGFVTDLHEGSLTSRGTRSYALTLRPKLWTLSQRSDCRIFRGTTSPQIVETLCKEHGISDLELRITGQPAPQDYSVQWNETDLAYMLRRIEEDGLFYWFLHKQGAHTLVVSDHVWGYDMSPEPEPRFTEGSPAQDYINRWRRSFAFTPGKRTGRDWAFLTMSTPEATQPSFATVPGNAPAELYEFPGRFADTSGAEQMTKHRIQATETGFETVEAASTVRTLGPAQKITPRDVAKPENVFAQQVITAIRHEAEDRTYETNAGVPSYANTFAVMPATTPATPHRTIRRPKIIGSQIALIAGPSGEEIFTDQWGRIKVWFPWDRRAVKDGSDTCWMRVGQPWAGTTWGHQVIPRVGMECLISYQEGDPDRPFVTALVPDPTNPTPYTLPDNKTRMVFRSHSYKSSGNNEMTFEDATGGENQFFNASKDQTTNVVNNATRSIGVDQSVSVGQNASTTIGSNSTTEVGGSMNVSVGGTGAGASAMMAPLMGMAGATSGLLSQAMGAAGGAAGGGGMGAAPGLSLMSSAMGMVPAIAGAAIGVLSGAGQSAQSGVVAPSSPLSDAGTALAGAGSSLGAAVGALFGMSGMLNVSVANTRTDSIGVSHAMQVGTSQAINIGMTKNENVGQAHTHTVGQQMIINVGQEMQINVGKTFQIVVGNSTLTMDSDGNVTITGKTFTTDFSDQVSHWGKVIDLNPSR